MTVVSIKWKNETMTGFWFLTNFLRNEGIQETSVVEIIKDLTQQYEKYIGPGGKHFGPTIKVETINDHTAHIEIFQPVSEEKIGDVMFVIGEEYKIEIVPF